MPRLLRLLAALSLAILVSPLAAHAADVEVVGGGEALLLDSAIDEYEDGHLTVGDAYGRLAVTVDPASDALLRDGLQVLRVAQTQVGGKQVDDPLPPLADDSRVDGDAGLVVRVDTPAGTAAGVYHALLHVTLDGSPLPDVPVQLTVWDVTLPARDDP